MFHFRNTLEEIGVLSHKITIHGSDEIYENTRVKMAQAEEENRKGMYVTSKQYTALVLYF